SEERQLPGAPVPRAPRAPGLKAGARNSPRSARRARPLPPVRLPPPACTPRLTAELSKPPANPACQRLARSDEANRRRPHHFARLLAALDTIGGEHAAFIEVVIIELNGKAL